MIHVYYVVNQCKVDVLMISKLNFNIKVKLKSLLHSTTVSEKI